MSNQIAGDIFMVRPSQFKLNEETAVNNYFQPDPDEVEADNPQENAARQFDQLVDLLRSKGINVLVFHDYGSETPDSIFPNNWVTTHENGKAIVYPMFAENRRKERRQDILDGMMMEFELNEVFDLSHWEEKDQFLEGTGSMIFDRVNKIAYAALSERTDPEVLEKFSELTGYEVISFTSNQSVEGERLPIYHTNVMMAVGEAFAVICLESIDNEVEREFVASKLESTGKHIIPISEEQLIHFTGNILQLRNSDGKKFVVMSEEAYNGFSDDQKGQLSEHGEILYSPIPTIELLGGGSVRCMIAEIFLPKKPLS